MGKPAKRTAAVLNNQEDLNSEKVTRSNRSRDVSKGTSTKPAATVPKKRKIAVVEPRQVKLDEVVNFPSSSQDSQSSESSPKRGRKAKTERQKPSEKEKIKSRDLLPLPIRPVASTTLIAVGTGDIGQLGLGEDVLEKAVPVVVPLAELVCDIVAGGMHSVCLTKSGLVYTFGCNDEGALGRLTPNEEEQFQPGVVDIKEKVVQISAGDSHTAALTESGKVFIWGNFRDSKGPMGLLVGTGEKVSLPTQIMKEMTIVQISSGSNHFLCLDEEGRIWSCGNCEHGQLGRISSYNLERGGRKGIESCLIPNMVLVSRNVLFDKIWGGTYTSIARASYSGEIYGFGLNNYSQLGFLKTTILTKPQLLKSFTGKSWTAFSSGEHHTLALDSQGSVHSLGKFEYGRLGLGEEAADANKPTQIPSLKEVECIDVSCGSTVSYAVSKNGLLHSWGCGTNNQLGHNSDDDAFEPKQVECKALRTRNCVRASGGGQHALFIAQDKEPIENTNGE